MTLAQEYAALTTEEERDAFVEEDSQAGEENYTIAIDELLVFSDRSIFDREENKPLTGEKLKIFNRWDRLTNDGAGGIG